MGKAAVVAGTGFRNQDGSQRNKLIRKYVRDNLPVYFRREPSNEHDENAIAVLIKVPSLFGLLGTSLKQIGYIKAGAAKSLAKKLDAGEEIKGYVNSFYAPPQKDYPRVSLWLEY